MRFAIVALLTILLIGAGWFLFQLLLFEEHEKKPVTFGRSEQFGDIVNQASSERETENQPSVPTSESITVGGKNRDNRPISERKVCACLIGMTTDRSIGKASQINVGKMQSLFENEVHQSRWRNGGRDIVKDDRCNPKEILSAISKLVVEPEDALFVYYSGHGAYDVKNSSNDPTRGHYFDLDAGKLRREKLYQAMLKKGARLTVLVSDSCNVPELNNVDEMPPLMGGGVPPTMTDLERLLLLYQGQIDINSSSRDEYAFMDATNGGWFTFFYHRNMKSAKSWDDLFNHSRTQTNDFYRKIRNSKTGKRAASQIDNLMQKQQQQRPSAFRLQFQRAS